MLSVGCCGVATLQMKVGHMDGMHCFIDSTSILVKIKSVSLCNCRTVYIQSCEHSSKNNILAEEQFGFRTKTTNNAIYKLTNDILKALNNKLMVGGIFCDLEKALDCVNHEILLSELEFYGVKGKAKLCFESYFRNRYQMVLSQIMYSKMIFLHKAWSSTGIDFGPIVVPFLHK